MILDIFGRKELEITRVKGVWEAYYCGNNGLKRPATDVIIPDHLDKKDVIDFVADLFHEWATPTHNTIKVIID